MKNQSTIEDLVSFLHRDILLLTVNEFITPSQEEKEVTPFEQLKESLLQQNA